jgi:hypothetical protein
VAFGPSRMSGLSHGFEERKETRLLVAPFVSRHLRSREATQAVGVHL